MGKKLKQVERGEMSADDFLDEITNMITELTKTYQVIKGAEVLFPSGRDVIGKCPRCGSDVTESRKGFFCEKTTVTLASGATTGSFPQSDHDDEKDCRRAPERWP
jgi:hypothetical protein